MTENYRHFGARVLVLFNDPATLPALLAHTNDPQPDVRTAVRMAIRRIQKQGATNAPPAR
jgi:HEAT repeat protein